MVACCVDTILGEVRVVVTCQRVSAAMEIPLANAKMRTIAVIKDFMAGLVGARAEWLWITITVGVLAKNEREGIHTVGDFQGVVP